MGLSYATRVNVFIASVAALSLYKLRVNPDCDCSALSEHREPGNQNAIFH